MLDNISIKYGKCAPIRLWAVGQIAPETLQQCMPTNVQPNTSYDDTSGRE